MNLKKKKKLNQDMNSDRLSVAVVEFVIIDVVCCFLQNKKKEEEEETRKGNERHILGYNINIADRFTNKY